MVNAITLNPTLYPAGEFPASVASVYVNDKLSDLFTCISIENTAGTVPGKAILRFMAENVNGTFEADSPNTLKAYDNYIVPLFGSRISVVTNDATLFTGHLLRREDNGQSDTLMFTALDDREMLAKIPVRGAVVRDEYDTGGKFLAKFLTRYNTTANPNGLWNCIGHTVDIVGHPLDGEVVPVFAPRAYRRQNYESPDATFSDELKDGVLTPWTPRRMLQYLWFIAHIGARPGSGGIEYSPDIPGLQSQTWRSLRNYPSKAYGVTSTPESQYWDWGYETISSMVGAQPLSPVDDTAFPDPLDRKLPPMNFQGKALLQGIADVLTAAGTHNFRVKPLPIKELSPTDVSNLVPYFQGKVKSTIEFFPVGYTALMQSNSGRNINLMRGGKPSDLPNADTAYDFQLSEDITYTRNAVLVEGDVVRTETEVTVDAGLVPAWGPTEETAFRQIIWGSDDPEKDSETYCSYPSSQQLDASNVETFDKWLVADGKGAVDPSAPISPTNPAKQFAFARTPEAVQLARKFFPRVFRAFRLDSENSEIINALDGFDDIYSDPEDYPNAKTNRPVLSQQLQFQLADLDGGGGTENWLEEKFPIRVQVENNGEYQEAIYTSATSLGEGIFMVDMAENYNLRPQCIYSGMLFASGEPVKVNTLDVFMKNIKMNLAFPMDHRVEGFATSGSNGTDTGYSFSSINAFYKRDTGGDGYLQYIDSPGGYREEHQVNSTPTSFKNMVDGTDEVPMPLNRLLPPGSEADNATAAASRRLYGVQRIDRRSSWKMVGIRPVWEVGQWVDNIYPIGSGEYLYPIKAPILSIVHDFQAQVTTIGGLIGETY